jgi:uncharacterized protein (TIGR03435 family)
MYRKLGLAIAFVCATLSGGAANEAGSPYSQANNSNEGVLQFEVASVRENKSGSGASSNIPLDRSDTFSPTGCTLRAINQPFIAYLIFAYKINVSEFRGGVMRSMPPWAVKDRFDIVAKCADTNASKDEMRQMLQSLLADRFQLKVHRESRIMPILVLYPKRAGILGPQLKVHNSSCESPLPIPPPSVAVADLVGRWPQLCGNGQELRISKHGLRDGGRAMTMDQIADWLTGAGDLAFPIVNRSKLPGTFDFVLDFNPEKLEDTTSNPGDMEQAGPTFQGALEDQLGMRLRKETAAIPLFFVDQVQYPSEN